MKICLISPLFEPWLVGGAERYVCMLAHKLSENHQVLVITTVGPKPRIEKQSDNNPRIYEINPYNVSSLYDMIINDSSVVPIKKYLWHFFDLWNPSAYIKIKNILKKEKPDLIHTNGVKGLSSIIFSLFNELKIPHLHTIHDLELISRRFSLFKNGKPVTKFNFFDKIYIHLQRKLSSKINAVISPSKFMMDFYEKFGFFKNSEKFVIPNCIDFYPTISPKKYFTNDFLVLGSITEQKGFQIAINAFKKLSERNAKLHVVGEGPYLQTLTKISDGDKRIIFHGFIKNENLGDIFNKCSYIISPSLGYENFPYTIIEALSKGLPVIASNIGGIPELITHQHNGFLFEAGNVDSLHRILNTVVNEKQKFVKLGRNAIESSKKFSIEQQMKSTQNVYMNLITHR